MIVVNNDTCRICLGCNNLKDIFTEENSIFISEKVMFCASVKIAPDDSLPSKICNQCIFYVDIAYMFRHLCETNDMKLRNLLLNSKYLPSTNDVINEEIASQVETAIVENIASEEIVSNEFCLKYDMCIEENFSNDISKTTDLNISNCEDVIENIDTSVSNGPNILDNAPQGKYIILKGTDSKLLDHLQKLDDALKVPEENTDFYNVQICEEILIDNSYCNDNLNSCKVEIQENNIQLENDLTTTVSCENVLNLDDKHDKTVVGRHVAKKNASQLHKRIYQNVEISDNSIEPVHEVSKEHTIGQIKIISKKISSANEYILEDVFEKQNEVKLQCKNAPKANQKIINLKNNSKNIANNINKTNYVHDIDVRKQKELKNSKSRNKKLNSNKNSLQCNVCKKTFSFRSHLIRHIRTHTGLKPFACSYCFKTYRSSCSLSDHILTHTGNLRHICTVCNRGFAQPSILKRHMRSHTKEHPFECKFCQKLFMHSSSHLLHEQMHIKKPSFKCDSCGKSFSYSSGLAAHTKIHAGIKSHSCFICNKSFYRSSTLNRHMNCHDRNKILSCYLCLSNFTHSSALMQHMNKVHNVKGKYNNSVESGQSEEFLGCKQCGKKFTAKMSLIKHLKKHLTNR